MRYLRGAADAGLFLATVGDEAILEAWSDAGFGGVGTRSQSGLFLSWAGAGVLWRSSRQTVSALNTAEAELTAAAMAWQVVEGFRMLLEEWGVRVRKVHLLLDNAAALTITENGASWRTRYLSVRGGRIREEMSSGRLAIGHQPTKEMVADGLAKLATAEVMKNLRAAMGGDFPPAVLPPLPTVSSANSTSVDPGPQNRSDITGDGPQQQQQRPNNSPSSRPTTPMQTDSAPPKRKRQRNTGNQREQARWQALDDELSNAQQLQQQSLQQQSQQQPQQGADTAGGGPHPVATRRVTIVVSELFGKEGSLGIHVRLDNGVVIRFTQAEAETVGWRLGDRIVALDSGPVENQYELLSAMSLGKKH